MHPGKRKGFQAQKYFDTFCFIYFLRTKCGVKRKEAIYLRDENIILNYDYKIFLCNSLYFQIFLLLLPVLPAPDCRLPRLAPLRGERQVGPERGRAQVQWSSFQAHKESSLITICLNK